MKAPDPNDILREHGPEYLREHVAKTGRRYKGKNGGGKAESQARDAESQAHDAAADTIARLAQLSHCEYERQRKAAAEQVGWRVSMLDTAVKVARKSNGQVDQGRLTDQGRQLELSDPPIWDDAVNGAEILNSLAQAIRSYVVLANPEVDAAALWVLHTYLFDVFPVTPRLAVTSPEKQCGKTTLLDVLACLVTRPLLAANITVAATYRTIEMIKPTLLIDEADTYLGENEELRGVLNSGHRRGGSVIRLVGDKHEPRQFTTHAPVAIALIGTLPGTLADRSVRLRLRRRRRDERIIQFRSDHTHHLFELTRMLRRWAFDNREHVAESDPDCGRLFNRDADNWRCLFAIADAAGGDWPARARAAAEHLVAEAADDQESIGTMLLGDIRAAFRDRAADRLTSKDLMDHLNALEARPWAEFGRAGKPVTQNKLARLLKRFDIAPRTIRLDSGETAKGYLAQDFVEAFACYLQLEKGC